MTVVPVTVDSWINEANADHNYGDNAKMVLSGQSSSQKFAYVHIPRPFEYGSQIESALLRFHVAGDWSVATTVAARRVTSAWKENRVTWANRPNDHAPSAVTESVSGLADTDVVEVDVASILQDVSDDPTMDYVGFRLSISTNPDRKIYASNTPDSELWPELDVVWAEGPEPPDRLAPDGGSAAFVVKPVFTWRFRDVSEEGTQVDSQLQIDTTDDFASPVYDTGQAANVNSAWDSTTTGAVTNWAGMSAATTYYWRVRVWDDSGIASDWSDTAEVTYDAPGTLTLNNPPAGGSSFVEETTPIIAWTLSSATQEAARVILDEMNSKGLWVEIWRMPWEVTTDDEVTVPSKLIHSKRVDGQDTLYRVTVDVRDDVDRQSTPGQLGYLRAQQTFTYDRSGAPAAVATLTATPSGHFVDLAWTRSTMPDYFSIMVDGREVEPRVESNDVFVSGTSYAMRWCRARGGVAHTYEVEAVTLPGLHSDANATASATTDPFGIVLVDDTDPADPVSVVLRGLDGPGLSIGQTGETFRLHGARKPVRIVDSVGGYEGSVSGRLMSNTDKDTFETLLSTQPETELRLIIADINVPVVLGDVTMTPQPEATPMWEVDVEVFQTGEFTIEAS